MSARIIHRPRPLRRGFTLTELLVVMAIIAVLAGISVYAFQPFQNRSAVNNGGVLLQSWLTAAKSKALRDQLPRGIRLLPGDEIVDDAGNPITTLVTKCVFIEQQEDIAGGIVSSGNNGMQLTTTAALPVALTSADCSYVEINGGPLHQVASASGNSIALARPLPVAIPQNSGATFRIFRTPKATTFANTADTASSSSDDILRIPRGAAINLGANAQFSGAFGYSLYPAAPPLDIMFAPNGAVTFPNPNYDKIILWVTATQRDAAGTIDPRQGKPNLVVVNSRTGFIGGYAVKLDWNASKQQWNKTSPYLLVP